MWSTGGREGTSWSERRLHPEALVLTHKRHILIGFQNEPTAAQFWHLTHGGLVRHGGLVHKTRAAQNPNLEGPMLGRTAGARSHSLCTQPHLPPLLGHGVGESKEGQGAAEEHTGTYHHHHPVHMLTHSSRQRDKTKTHRFLALKGTGTRLKYRCPGRLQCTDKQAA